MASEPFGALQGPSGQDWTVDVGPGSRTSSAWRTAPAGWVCLRCRTDDPGLTNGLQGQRNDGVGRAAPHQGFHGAARGPGYPPCAGPSADAWMTAWSPVASVSSSRCPSGRMCRMHGGWLPATERYPTVSMPPRRSRRRAPTCRSRGCRGGGWVTPARHWAGERRQAARPEARRTARRLLWVRPDRRGPRRAGCRRRHPRDAPRGVCSTPISDVPCGVVGRQVGVGGAACRGGHRTAAFWVLSGW